MHTESIYQNGNMRTSMQKIEEGIFSSLQMNSKDLRFILIQLTQKIGKKNKNYMEEIK